MRVQRARWFVVWPLSTVCLGAQSCVMLSRTALASDGTAVMDVMLYSRSGASPAALQWSLQATVPAVPSLTVDAGPQLTAAGKTITCTVAPTAYTCIAVGPNANPITNGIVARVTVVLSSGTRSIGIRLANNPTAADAEGYFVPVRAAQECRFYRPSPGEVELKR